MPIPKINLIPPAYYLRKKVKVAVGIAIFAIVVEAAGLVAFAVYENGRNAVLVASEQEWQGKVDNIARINDSAGKEADSVKETKDKTDFIKSVFDANGQWSKVFKGIADYTNPNVVYTSIKPTVGGTSVAIHMKLVGGKKVNLVRALNLYRTNLSLSPIIKSVLPGAYPTTASDTSTSGSISGSTMPGGPPMPGGGPVGASLSSPTQLTSGVLQAANNYSSELGGPQISMPTVTIPGSTSGIQSGISVPAGPPMYDVDVSVDLLNPITVPSKGQKQN
jgi:hypothetical protein